MTTTTPPGQVLRDENGMRLEFVRTFDADVHDVWSALTESDRLGRWFGTWSGDPATGTVELRMWCEDDAATPQGREDDAASPQTVTIVECAEPTRLVVDLPSPDDTWRLEVSLSEDDGTTTLVFTQRLAEPYDATSIGPGWHYYLDRLSAVVANTPVPQTWDDDYLPALKDTYALPG